MKAFKEKKTRVDIPGPCGILEAKTLAPVSTGPLAGQKLLAVVCHPHPLQGGTMENKVVTTLTRAYRDLGIPVVYFNFRGVGTSDGTFDNAVGEVNDLLAVVDWAEQLMPGRRLVLAGFSFGSSVAAQGSYQVQNLAHLTLVAPPVGRYPFDRDKSFTAPVCVIQGDKDEVVDANEVYDWAEQITSPLDILRDEDACHYFHGKIPFLKHELPKVLINRIYDQECFDSDR